MRWLQERVAIMKSLRNMEWEVIAGILHVRDHSELIGRLREVERVSRAA